EAARAEGELTAWHADQRRDAGVQGTDRNLKCSLDRRRPMLQVDEQKVVPGGLHETRDLNAAYGAQADPECELALLQALLGGVYDGWHVRSPLFLNPKAATSKPKGVDAKDTKAQRQSRKRNPDHRLFCISHMGAVLIS